MSWFIITWNPDVWTGMTDDDWDSYVADGDPDFSTGNWSTGSRHTGIDVGDGLIFLRQGRDRGVMAFGEATSEVYEGPHYNDPERTAWYVDYEWTTAATIDGRIPTELLLEAVPNVPWNSLYGSGVHISDEDAELVLNLWNDELPEWAEGVSLPTEEDSAMFLEGNRTTVSTNRYERDPAARAAAIAAHGATCQVCGFDFQARYGERGAGYIEVHHLVPLAELDGVTSVDPAKDMLPLCSNCHSIIHRGGLISPDDLRALLR